MQEKEIKRNEHIKVMKPEIKERLAMKELTLKYALFSFLLAFNRKLKANVSKCE